MDALEIGKFVMIRADGISYRGKLVSKTNNVITIDSLNVITNESRIYYIFIDKISSIAVLED